MGYDVTISVPTFTALPGVGAEAALHIHTQVSEDQIALFGSLDAEEKHLFERLITVNAVGPKLAIKILSGLSVERTVQAIRAQDHAQLVRIPGAGKKLAERLVVELKDKLDEFACALAPAAVAGPAVADVLSALVNLGYQRMVRRRRSSKQSPKTRPCLVAFFVMICSVRLGDPVGRQLQLLAISYQLGPAQGSGDHASDLRWMIRPGSAPARMEGARGTLLFVMVPKWKTTASCGAALLSAWRAEGL